MKVIAINGSPHKNGNTAQALGVMAEELRQQGIEVEILHIGHQDIHGCIGCGYCKTSEGHHCVFKDDLVNEVALKMREADGFILGAPTYYAGIAGTMKSFLDRVFYTSSTYFAYKVATSITVVRRAGGVPTVDQLNHFLQLGQTVTPPSHYWLAVYGAAPGEVLQDSEGIQAIRQNARSMAWLLQVIEASKGSIPLPAAEQRVRTNFIR